MELFAGLKHTKVGSRIAIGLCVLALLSGCAIANIREYADRVVRAGATVEDMKKAHGVNAQVWQKPSYYLPNGDAVYVEAASSRGVAYCAYHWEVNAQGRVVGYKIVGRPYWCEGQQDEEPKK
jgi:hypothetical protein